MGSYISRVYSSERVSSSHGPDIFYEFVHAHVKPDPKGMVGADVVILRMVQGDGGDNAFAPEIHVADLGEVQERFQTFMDRVRKKTGDTSVINMPRPGSQVSPVPGVVVTEPAPAAAHTPMAPHPTYPAQTPPVAAPEFPGRFAPGTPRKKPTNAPDGGPPPTTSAPMPSMGPKKSSFTLGSGAPVEGAAEPQAPAMSGYEIVTFTLQKPPELDGVLKIISEDPAKLIVVARMELHDKIRIYLENVLKGDGSLAQKPGAFSAVVVQRQGGKMNFKQKMSGPVASAITQIVANPTKVLWVPPEGA